MATVILNPPELDGGLLYVTGTVDGTPFTAEIPMYAIDTAFRAGKIADPADKERLMKKVARYVQRSARQQEKRTLDLGGTVTV